MPHVELPQAEFKVVMLGDTCTGKTSLVLRFAEGYYRDEARSEATVGAFFITKRLQVNGITCKIQIWDTAGQAQFRPMAPMYYKNAAAAIVCYDVSSPSSFQVMKYWLDELHKNLSADSIVLAIAATKTDLVESSETTNSNSMVPTVEAEALANSVGAIFVDTSAKANTNVTLLFRKVAERVLRFRERKKKNGMDSYYYAAASLLPVTPGGSSRDLQGQVAKRGSATASINGSSINGDVTAANTEQGEFHQSNNSLQSNGSSKQPQKRRDKRSKSKVDSSSNAAPEISITASDIGASNNSKSICGEDPMLTCGILPPPKKGSGCIIL